MKEQLQKDFDNTIRNLTLSQKDIEIKKFYLDNFINKGFPNRKEEDWKFSDLREIVSKNFSKLNIKSSEQEKSKMLQPYHDADEGDEALNAGNDQNT